MGGGAYLEEVDPWGRLTLSSLPPSSSPSPNRLPGGEQHWPTHPSTMLNCLTVHSETMVPVFLGWNLWSHEPNAIFHTLNCFSQGFACAEKPDWHTLLTTSCRSPYRTQVHIIDRTWTQLRQAPWAGWGRGELTRKPCASSLRCLWDTSPGRWAVKRD